MDEADVVAPIAKANVAKANNAITNASGVADYLLDVIDQIKDKEQDGIFNNSNIKQAINFLTKAKGVEEMSTSGGAGAYLTPYAFRLKGSKPNIKAYKDDTDNYEKKLVSKLDPWHIIEGKTLKGACV